MSVERSTRTIGFDYLSLIGGHYCRSRDLLKLHALLDSHSRQYLPITSSLQKASSHHSRPVDAETSRMI